MHLYGVYPKTRASLVAKKRDGRFRGIRHYQTSVRGKLTIVESAVVKLDLKGSAIVDSSLPSSWIDIEIDFWKKKKL